jgi:hypothetical protein
MILIHGMIRFYLFWGFDSLAPFHSTIGLFRTQMPHNERLAKNRIILHMTTHNSEINNPYIEEFYTENQPKKNICHPKKKNPFLKEKCSEKGCKEKATAGTNKKSYCQRHFYKHKMENKHA